MIRTSALAVLLLAALACGRDREGEPEESGLASATDTTEIAPMPGRADLPRSDADLPTAGPGEPEAPAEPDTAETTPDSIAEARTESLLLVPAGTAPTPPGGYAVETRPAKAGKLGVIEYASPKSVEEVAEFYDSRFRFPQRVVLDIMGDDMIVYGLTDGTSIGPSTTPQDVERLLDQRGESMLVVSPWKVQRDDPLIRDLRDADQDAQADALLQTKTKVTVISRPPDRLDDDESS